MRSEDKFCGIIMIVLVIIFFSFLGSLVLTDYTTRNNMAKQHMIHLNGWYPDKVLKGIKEMK